MKGLTNGQVLKNVSIFISYEVKLQHLEVSGRELADSLLAEDVYLTVKRLVTSSTSSNPTVYGKFTYKVGKNSYELRARYNEDNEQWELVF